MEPQIQERICGLDNIEIIRDHLARVLKCELDNQAALAPDPPDGRAAAYRVFMENPYPYEFDASAPNCPVVNVALQEISAMPSARSGQQKQKAVFIIDCIASGDDGGSDWSEKAAPIRALAAASVVRRILMSDSYVYLGLRGIVGSRNIVSIQSLARETEDAAPSLAVARITLEVAYIEGAIEAASEILEDIGFSVLPSSGEVVENE